MSLPTTHRRPQSVVILGGGIVGCATAYYLHKLAPQTHVTIVDKVAIAAAASGRAGGFLARDWHGGAVAKLARKSFELHKELSVELGGAEAIGYRPCRAVQTAPLPMQGKREETTVWWDGCREEGAPEISPREATAQVIPARVTAALFEKSAARLVVGTATKLQRRDESASGGRLVVTLATSNVEDTEMRCDALLVACGPWSSQVAESLGLTIPTVWGQKASSVLLEPRDQSHHPTVPKIDDTCLFMPDEFEIYPRIDGVYSCGFGESPRIVDEAPGEVKCDPAISKKLVAASEAACSHLCGAKVLVATACHLPISSTGEIIAGEIEGQQGCFVATGHSCWGILNGPATGLGMAEMILNGGGGGATAATLLKPFAPPRRRRRR